MTYFAEASVPKAKGAKSPPTQLRGPAAVKRLLSECKEKPDADKDSVLLKDVEEVQRLRHALDDTETKLLHEMVTQAVANIKTSASGSAGSSSAAASSAGPPETKKAKTAARGSKNHVGGA